MIYNDEILTAAVEAVDIRLADLPIVLGDPTHRRHGKLVAALDPKQRLPVATASVSAAPPRRRVNARCTDASEEKKAELMPARRIGAR